MAVTEEFIDAQAQVLDLAAKAHDLAFGRTMLATMFFMFTAFGIFEHMWLAMLVGGIAIIASLFVQFAWLENTTEELDKSRLRLARAIANMSGSSLN